MELKIDAGKDVVKVEAFEKTDMASVSIWEAGSMNWITGSEVLTGEFVKAFGGELQQLLEKAVVVDTGSDGNFMVKVVVNQELSEDDTKNVYKSVKGIKVVTAGTMYMGSPEWMGYKEAMGVEKNWIDVLNITPGNYILDAYSLLIKDEMGKPKFMQFAYVITPEAKYVGTERNISTSALKLKYVSEG
jgi:hypothetical protein